MTLRHILCGLIVCMTVTTLQTDLSAAAGHRRPEKSSDRYPPLVPGVVVVKFKTAALPGSEAPLEGMGRLGQAMLRAGIASLGQMFKSFGATGTYDPVGLSRIYYARFDERLDPLQVARSLQQLPEVEYAEPKFLRHLYDTPNDPNIGSQNLALTRMNVFRGWTLGKGNPQVVIATVDGGTYWQHEDLTDNLWVNPLEDINQNGRFDKGPPPTGDEDGIDQDQNGFVDDVIGWNFTNSSNDPRGVTPIGAEHGTNTASMFGARTDNGVGMAGTSWNCRLMPVCVGGTLDGYISYGYEGIAYAAQNGAKVINCSWGATGGYSFFEQDVINAATQAGALVVVSAGNGYNNSGSGKSNDLTPDYPANYANVLAVGSTRSSSDVRSSFSNYGLTVPVFAPGESILGATNSGGYSQFNSGTSFSSPLVAGLAGLLKAKFPGWTPEMIAAQIRVTSDSIDGANPGEAGQLGRGRVNFERALSEFSHPGIQIVSGTFETPSGGNVYVIGDTVYGTLVVKNVLPTDAANLTFAISSSDPSLEVVQGNAFVGLLHGGEGRTLSGFRFFVGPLTSAKDIRLKTEWVSNGNERDAFAFKLTIFPTLPLWRLQGSPVAVPLMSVKAVSANVAWAAGGNGNATSPVVVRTTDGGEHWSVVTGNLAGADLFCIFAVDEYRAWVGTGDGRIFGTTDGGTTWNQQAYGGVQSPFIDGFYFSDTQNGFAMGDPHSGSTRWVVLKTSDGGQTWSHLADEPVGASGEAGWNNSFCGVDADHIWFGTNKNKIWRTTDGGNSWSASTSGGTDSYAVSFKDPMFGIAGHSNSAISRTTDGGATWTLVSSPAASAIIGAAYVPNSTFACVASFDSPFNSTDDGTSWQVQSTYPYAGDPYHLSFADTSNGWAVTSSAEILAYRRSGVTGVRPGQEAVEPASFVLSQNYPNPFNPSTVISYHLPVAATVSLKVFDLLGREVSSLVDGQRGPGDYSVTFDATGLSSGVYLFQLRAASIGTPGTGSFMAARKLLVMK
jgi:subtilisin family serine protease/photosystem II stability/assembly factor-like uncharacterized protein